ncbi:MAG: prepilin-type N-terminal cleavage/methylation domain-containing protein [Burkholderiaceae bacterium]|nr:prepilin-type N-terminal cleavage/methylation domain-containing protein [Burkholderiaceae bacterium]
MNALLAVRQAHAGRRRGLSLMELLVGLAIVAVLMAVAAPSMYEFIMRKRVQGTVDELLGDLRLMRSTQAQRNARVVIRFGSTASMSCYAVYQFSEVGRYCDCTLSEGSMCAGSATTRALLIKTVKWPNTQSIRVEPNSGSATEVLLESVTGLPENGHSLSVDVSAGSGGRVRVQTSPTFRASACSVSGHAAHYPACGGGSS